MSTVKAKHRHTARHSSDDARMVGDRVRELREMRGLNQPELARRIGIAQASLSLIESGKTKTLKASTLMRMAQVLEVDPEYIRTGRRAAQKPTGYGMQEQACVTLLSRMTAEERDSWMEIGESLLRAKPQARVVQLGVHPANAPSGDVVREIVGQLEDILKSHGPVTLSRVLADLKGASAVALPKGTPGRRIKKT